MNSFYHAAGRVGTLFACIALVAGLVRATEAQARKRPSPPPRQERGDAPDGTPVGPGIVLPLRELGDTVAIIPWNYKNNRTAAVQSAHEACSQLLLGTGFNVFLLKSATGAMPPPMTGISGSKQQQSAFENLVGMGRNLVTQNAPNKNNPVYILPTVEEMTAIGEKLHSRYVLAGRAQWRSRDVWIGVSNRIKSICSVDVRILDVNSRHLVLDAHGIEGDSTENKNLYNTFTNIMALNPLPLVIPGGIGPHEQRAVTVAIARALRPWLKTERIRMGLAQAEESNKAAAGGKTLPQFSVLLSPINDLQANLRVTGPNGKPPDVGDKEMNRLYALHDLTLQYKEPNQIRLTATSPKDGPETLLITEDSRSFAVGMGKKIARRDLTNSPDRQNLLFEFCGVLTTSAFDTTRARFVKRETVDGVPTLVYDLTYWSLDDGPYHRVWIDPQRRVMVKREQFDASSKLKRIVYYRQPTEVAPNLWIPVQVDLQDGSHKALATLQITHPLANRGLLDSVFTLGVP